LRRGAELAGVEIPGGELAVVPELIRGHPSPLGLDVVGTCIGTVPLDRVVSGARIAPGDAVIGLPSSGLHSNGFTLAREALFDKGGYSLDDAPAEIGRTLAEELLEPTEIYVRAVLELLGAGAEVRGLAHITGDGLLNLLRLNEGIGYEIDDPLPPQPIFGVIERAGEIPPETMYETFNMGTGFCCIVAEGDVDATLTSLRERYPAAQRVGAVISESEVVHLPSAGLVGRDGRFSAA
jgi:phosphoribosylformylglycinamidine cyclo-ligase